MKHIAFLLLMVSTVLAYGADTENSNISENEKKPGKGSGQGGGGGHGPHAPTQGQVKRQGGGGGHGSQGPTQSQVKRPSGGGGHVHGATPSMSRTGQFRSAEKHAGGGGSQKVQQFIKHQNTQQARPRAQPQVKPNYSDIRKNNANQAAHVRQSVKQNRPQTYQYFDNRFFENHQYNPQYHYKDRNYWGKTHWNDLNRWVDGSWNDPIYYDYYDDGDYPIVINNYQDYYDVEQAPSQPVYVVPDDASNVSDWMPIGVYLVAESAEQAQYSNIYIQLAVKKSGEIGGTYYNSVTDQNRQLVGMVDREKQEAVFLFSDQSDSPLVTTGMFNLTQDATPIQVHFPDGTLQTWVMVRLEQ